MRRVTSLQTIALLLLACACTMADTVDTFTFTQPNWSAVLGSQPATGLGTLTGSFTGTVESSGFIEAPDLTSFSAQLVFADGLSFSYDGVSPPPSGGAPFFSYDVNGGASSLDFVTTNQHAGLLCEGAAAPLACEAPNGSDFGYAAVGSETQQQVALTLVSSVTTGSAGTSTAPEPASVGIVVLGAVLFGAWRMYEHGARARQFLRSGRVNRIGHAQDWPERG